MFRSIGFFLNRPPPPSSIPTEAKTYTHTCCASFPYCTELHGEALMSSGTSPTHSLNTLYEDYFSASPSVNTRADFKWDSDYGWGIFCHDCEQERCEMCEGRVFTAATNFEAVLTFESMEFWVCVPCRHKMCRGWRVVVVSLCGVCGHQGCEACFSGGADEGGDGVGLKCCACENEVRAEEESQSV